MTTSRLSSTGQAPDPARVAIARPRSRHCPAQRAGVSARSPGRRPSVSAPGQQARRPRRGSRPRRGGAGGRRHHRAGRAGGVAVGLGAPGRARAGDSVYLPPLHQAGRRCPAGRLVAAGRRGGLLGCRGRRPGRWWAGVREDPGYRGRSAQRRARRCGPGPVGRGRPPAAAGRRTGAARGLDATARVPAAPPARRGSTPDDPGLGRTARFTAPSHVRQDDRDRPGAGQLAHRRGRPRREHLRRRRRRALAPSPAGLRLGSRRAKPEPHTRRPRGRRRGPRRGPGSHRAPCRPGAGCGTALPARQFLAGRIRRMAGPPLAAPRQARHRHAAYGAGHVMADDLDSAGLSATLGAHELVLLHGQPGSAADWVQVAERLPPQLHVVAADRPGYGSSELPAAGFAANARAVLDDLDARGIHRAVLVGHSYGGGVALSAASLAPHRVEAVVLLASVGPGCVNGWDRLLAAPGVGQLCALVAWRLTPWIARARIARIARRRGRPLRPDEHVNWNIWGHVSREHGPLWRTFLAEQRALLRELDELESAVPAVQAPVLLLADPQDHQVPVDTGRWLAQVLPDARL